MLLIAESGSIFAFSTVFSISNVRSLGAALEPQSPPHQRFVVSPFFNTKNTSTELPYSPVPVVESVSVNLLYSLKTMYFVSPEL